MNYSALEKSSLFKGVPANQLRHDLEITPYIIRSFEKDEIIFHAMDNASNIGIVLEGRVQAQKTFPNGSQINVTMKFAGEMIGPAAVFSSSHRYPCDVVALEPVTIILFKRENILALMQRDIHVLENLTTEIASSTYMLQQRLELLSYSGIAQKAAYYLLLQARHSGSNTVRIPESFSKWAMIMNVSRPSLYREIKKLENLGILSYSPPNVTLLDPDQLQALLSE